jgi:hypothetical protein
MNDNLAGEHSDLLTNYQELAEGLRLIRRAVERACRAGVLPPIDLPRNTPREECEAIARAIYQSALSARHHDQTTNLGARHHDQTTSLAGLSPDDPSTSV